MPLFPESKLETSVSSKPQLFGMKLSDLAQLWLLGIMN